VQRGKSSFDTQSFIDEWNAYPESFSQGLGVHTNACVAPVVQWDKTQITVNENAGTVQADIKITGSQPDWVDGSFWDVPPPGQTSWAIEGQTQDFTAAQYGTFQFSPNSSQLNPVNVADIIDDTQPELTEWFALDINNVNGATIGTNNVLLFKITDNDGLSVQDIEIANQVLVFPTVFNEFLSISTDNPAIEFKAITLIDVMGRSILMKIEPSNGNEIRVPVNELANGYITAIIRTNKGIAVKKLLKMNTTQ